MKDLITPIGVIFIAVFVGLIYLSPPVAPPAPVVPQDDPLFSSSFALAECYLDEDVEQSTSTPVYMVATTATTTLTCPSLRADIIDINVLPFSTSTPIELLWTYEFSNNKIDWYAEDGRTLTTNNIVTHGADPVIHTWTSSSTASTTESLRPRKNIGIDPVASKYFRVGFTVDGPAALFVQAILREKR
jgi:hypothetical protein